MECRLVCPIDQLKPGTSTTLDGATPIAVFRSEDGEVFATADSCTHELWSLGEEGEIEGAEVVCSLHMARFDLRTGRALSLPATEALPIYQVHIADGQIYVVE